MRHAAERGRPGIGKAGRAADPCGAERRAEHRMAGRRGGRRQRPCDRVGGLGGQQHGGDATRPEGGRREGAGGQAQHAAIPARRHRLAGGQGQQVAGRGLRGLRHHARTRPEGGQMRPAAQQRGREHDTRIGGGGWAAGLETGRQGRGARLRRAHRRCEGVADTPYGQWTA
jgi:hypothetical protein